MSLEDGETAFLGPTGAQEDGMCVCVLVIMLRMPLKEFLKHSKESRGVLEAGKQAVKHASKQAST